MPIHTQESLSGFIASDPQLSFTSKGEARFYARIGQEHYQRNDDGTFTQTETTFHDLVMYRRTAERAYEQFAKGDNFIAEGYVHPYSYERDGQTVTGEEFVAKRLGHDVARSTYTVERARRQAPAVDQSVTQPVEAPPAVPAPAPSTAQPVQAITL